MWRKRMIKKITLLINLVILSLLLMGNTTSNVTILSKVSQNIHGATHERVQRNLNVNGTNILQTYHYLGADFSTNDFRIITGDDYTTTGYRLATTKKHAEVSQAKYDQYLIIGGVNADFFGGGAPIEAYIEDGQVISSGQGFYREVVGFKKNGEVALGTPEFDGYEIVVKDNLGKERIRLPIKNINAPYVNHPFDIFVYFDTYTAQLQQNVPKYIITATETKGALPKIFGTGNVLSVLNTHAMTTQSGQITVMSHNPYLQELIQVDDKIIVQRKLVGDFKGVEWAVGGWGKLVINGVKNSNIVSVDPTFRAPRTAIGIKADKSVFFVAVDGRQPGYSQGITLYELADLMLDYGAVDAYNFDGGGSTTMTLRNESDGFDIVNQPSDGSPRLVTNSVFLAIQVRFDDLTPHPIPNYALKLNTPNNLSIVGSTLTFTGQTGTLEYEVTINDQSYRTKLTSFNLSTVINTPGDYQITVKSIGDGFYYQTSDESLVYHYEYQGPVKLEPPTSFRMSGTTLYWDETSPNGVYIVKIEDKTYTLFLNRFNLGTQSLPPGVYFVEVIKVGDGYLTEDSLVSTYRYRIYSNVENEIKSAMNLIKELLILKNK
jgi:hypothetical protein